MATEQQLATALRNAHNAGDVEAARKLAKALKGMREAPAQTETYNATDGMSGAEKFLAGVGMGMTNVARGIGQAAGMVSREDISEARRLEKDLSETTAGQVGNVVGAGAAYVPAMFVPGANTLTGAAAIGAATGLLAPSESTKETATNTAVGGVLGPVATVAGRSIPAAWQGVKAIAEPFSKRGQEAIAGRTLQRFAGDPNRASQAANNLTSNSPAVSGVVNTAGEAADSPGIAQLERALRQNPDASPQIADRLSANRQAMFDRLQSIAGDDQAMIAAEAARESASQPLYEKAFQRNIAPDAALAKLSERPAMQEAINRAMGMVSESGRDVPPGEFLHFVKMSLDDMISTGPQRGIGAGEAKGIKATRDQFLDWFEGKAPEYKEAREAYLENSKAINQMEVGRELLNKFQPALADFGADNKTTPATFAKALRDADAFAKKATGRPNAKLSEIMTPEQMRDITGIAKELAKRAKADEMGRIPGSPTAQNIVSQNILRQTLGPLGLPESATENTFLNTLMRGPQFAAKLGEERTLNSLAQAVLDPNEAARLLTLAEKVPLSIKTMNRLSPYAKAASLTAVPVVSSAALERSQ